MWFKSLAAAIFITASLAFAQTRKCETAKPFDLRNVNGVVVEKIVLVGTWGHTEATVLLPNTESANAAIVFSHSTIRQNNGPSTDLLPMAFTLARAGAAAIVPDRAMEWPPKDALTNREGPVVTCAARWIVKNTKVPNGGVPIRDSSNRVIREPYAYVGPLVCRSTQAPDCKLTSPINWPHQSYPVAHVPLGEESNGSTKNAIDDGGLKTAQWLQRVLGLRRINAIEQPIASSGL